VSQVADFSAALIATAAGILVALPALLAHNFLRTRIDRFEREFSSAGMAPHTDPARPRQFRLAQTLPLKKRFSILPPFALITAAALASFVAMGPILTVVVLLFGVCFLNGLILSGVHALFFFFGLWFFVSGLALSVATTWLFLKLIIPIREEEPSCAEPLTGGFQQAFRQSWEELHQRVIHIWSMDPPLRLVTVSAIAQVATSAVVLWRYHNPASPVDVSQFEGQHWQMDWRVFGICVFSMIVAWSFVLAGASRGRESLLLVLTLLHHCDPAGPLPDSGVRHLDQSDGCHLVMEFAEMAEEPGAAFRYRRPIRLACWRKDAGILRWFAGTLLPSPLGVALPQRARHRFTP
jgi:hypothetical protein